MCTVILPVLFYINLIVPYAPAFLHSLLLTKVLTSDLLCLRNSLGPGAILLSWSKVQEDNKSSRQRISAEMVSFDTWVTADGSSEFKAEAGRYHLYISWACPFAHRALIARKLKGLEDVISLSTTDAVKDEKGWAFLENKDPINHCSFLSEIYQMAYPGFDGRVSVPVLWDKQQKKIVNNESADILRIFNSQFNEFCKTKEQAELDLYPDSLKEAIDSTNEWVAP